MKSYFTVTTEHGLHARPAAKLVKAVARIPAELEIRYGEKSTTGKSLFELLSLGVTYGARIEVTATGHGAPEIMTVIEQIVQGREDNVDAMIGAPPN